MALAQKVGRGMKTLALLLLSTLSLPAATYYFTIAGLGGEPDSPQRFKMGADDIDGSLKKAGGDAAGTPLNAPQLAQIPPPLADIAKPPTPAASRVGHLV